MVQKIDPWERPEKYSSWYKCPDCGLKAIEPEFEKRSNKNEKSDKLAGFETRRPLYPREYKRCPECDTQPRKLHTLYKCNTCGTAHPEKETAEHNCC